MTARWSATPLSQLLDGGLRNGLSPSTKGTVSGRVLTLSAVTQGKFAPRHSKDALFAKKAADNQYATKGMLLICRGNGNINLVGRGHIATDEAPSTIFPDTIIGGRLNTALVDPAFFEFAWNHADVRRQIERAARTTNGTHKVNQKSLSKVKVPLPPLAEQQRIAAILQEAESLRQERSQTVTLHDELIRAVFLEMFGDPVTNPKGLSTRPLGDLVTFVGGGTPSRSKSEYFEGTICWATPKDMHTNVLRDTQEHITEAAIQASATKLVTPPALLVVVKSKILARRLPVARIEVPTCFGQDLKAIVPRNAMLTRFLHRHLTIGSSALLGAARGANTEGLTLSHLANYRLLWPGERAVSVFSTRENEIMESRKLAVTASESADHLFNSLAQRAFRGEL